MEGREFGEWIHKVVMMERIIVQGGLMAKVNAPQIHYPDHLHLPMSLIVIAALVTRHVVLSMWPPPGGPLSGPPTPTPVHRVCAKARGRPSDIPEHPESHGHAHRARRS